MLIDFEHAKKSPLILILPNYKRNLYRNLKLKIKGNFDY
jgi:hypothetical protein